MDTEVLIVGAGPSGLTLATVLAEHGVSFRVVDRKSGPVEQSRAALVHIRTLELLDRLGVAGRAVADGVRLERIQIREHGRRAGEFPLAGAGAEGLTPFPYALALEQHRTEQLLIDALAERGARVEWEAELVDLTGASAVVRRSTGDETITARWVVGADGASSRVRHAIGLGFAGRTYPQFGFLADVDLAGVSGLDPGTIRLNLTRGGFVGMCALRAGRYRLFGAVPPGLASARGPGGVSHEAFAQVGLDEVQRWFDEYFHVDARVVRAEWSSLFRSHSRIVERFRVGPVFLMGDAAHVHSPAGGQGMNLGIGDAINLGWKLALVAKGRARAGLLDSYDAERRPVARTVLRNSDRGFWLEVTANPVVAWLRTNVLARLIGPLTRLPAIRTAVFRLFSQTWIRYPDSPAVARALPGRGPHPGDRAPYAAGLFETIGGLRHHVLLFEGDRPDPALGAYRDTIAALVDCDIHVISTKQRVLHDLYGARAGRVVLVRPDGHVGYIGGLADLGDLVRYLDGQLVAET